MVLAQDGKSWDGQWGAPPKLLLSERFTQSHVRAENLFPWSSERAEIQKVQKSNYGLWEGKDLVTSHQRYLFCFPLHHPLMAATMWVQESSCSWAGSSAGTWRSKPEMWRSAIKDHCVFPVFQFYALGFTTQTEKSLFRNSSRGKLKYRIKIGLFPPFITKQPIWNLRYSRLWMPLVSPQSGTYP